MNSGWCRAGILPRHGFSAVHRAVLIGPRHRHQAPRSWIQVAQTPIHRGILDTHTSLPLRRSSTSIPHIERPQTHSKSAQYGRRLRSRPEVRAIHRNGRHRGCHDLRMHRRRIWYREVRYRYCWCGNVQTGSHHEVSDPRCHVRYHCRLLPSHLRPHRPGPVAPWNWKRIQLVQWFHASGLRCLCRLHRSRSWLHDWYCRRQGRPLVHGAVSCIRRHGSDSHFRRSFGSLRSHCRSDPEHQVQGLNADSDSTKTKWRNTNDILATPFDIVTPLYIKRGERRDVG